ncbi:MAG: hypothetical protein IT483_03410 [Gammaproteobacteria bacterium]|nr:hypothetical protein [Gammaproteobacteria bacterium]
MDDLLQRFIVGNLAQLFGARDLVLVGTGVETSAGLVDILAREGTSRVWVIQTLIGTADGAAAARLKACVAAIAGLAEYAGREVLGVLVAADFDADCERALQDIERISTRRYSIAFSLDGSAASSRETVDDSYVWCVDLADRSCRPKGEGRVALNLLDRLEVRDRLTNSVIELRDGPFLIGRYRPD